MKKNLLGLLAFTMIGLAASAQTEQGNYLVGGNFAINTAKNDTRVTLTPTVGYFFINNFAGGANVDLTYSKAGSNKSTIFGIGPFARYYLGTLNIRPFAHANLNFTSNRSKNSAGSTTLNGSNYFLGAGLAAFINRNVAVEGLAGYSRTNYSHLSGSGGFNLRIGFQIYLSKEQVASVKNSIQ